MDYGARSDSVIEIIPDASALFSDRILPSLDQSIWATEDDYRTWNGDSMDSFSNQSNEGRQSQSRAGSEQPHSKKPRTSIQGDSAVSSGKSKALGKMFFKTKLCCKFRAGTCPYIANCNFAHGMEELRKPPPNWQEIVAAHEDGSFGETREEHQIPILTISPGVLEGQRSHKGRNCKKFSSEEGCPYGDSCTFLHDEMKPRESVAISLSPTVGGGYGGGGNGVNPKPSNWKTRICNKWEMTGYCPFGSKCHFAHGAAELHRYGGGLVETEARDSSATTADMKLAGASTKMIADAVTASNTSVPHGEAYHGGLSAQRSTMASQRQIQRPIQNWKGPIKISRIYGDWIDDHE